MLNLTVTPTDLVSSNVIPYSGIKALDRTLMLLGEIKRENLSHMNTLIQMFINIKHPNWCLLAIVHDHPIFINKINATNML
jgi:hypothetical protein